MTVSYIENMDNFRDTLSRAHSEGKVVLIDFTASWCGPCKMIAPILEKLAADADPSKIEFYKVDIDVDAMHEVVQKENITSVPSFFIYKDSQKADEIKGANPAVLSNLIQKHIA